MSRWLPLIDPFLETVAAEGRSHSTKEAMMMKSRTLALFIAAALAAGAAQASGKTPAPTAQQQATRAEIDRLVKRIEELSSQLGKDGDVRVIVREGRGPIAHGEFFEDGADGERRVHIERIGADGAPMALPPGARKWKQDGVPGADFSWNQGPGLGIVMAANTAASGVRIAAVTPDSPAMRAGIRTGDVLLQVNGKTITGNGSEAVENARRLIGKLAKGDVVKLRYARQGKTHDASVRADAIDRVMAFRRDAAAPRARAFVFEDGSSGKREHFEHLLPPGVEMEIQRLGPMRDCGKGKQDCGLPVIYEAFRWQGLNLASVDAGLGRYFGTQQGVLVLSSGEELKGLQSGDVIQRVGGTAVDSPREVMRALRDKEAGSQLRFDLMRDRRAAAVTVTVPASKPLPFMPPAPPAPPAAPPPPPMSRTPPPAPTPPAPPALD